MSNTRHNYTITFDCGLDEDDSLKVLNHIISKGAENVDGRKIVKAFPDVNQKGVEIEVKKIESDLPRLIPEQDRVSRRVFPSRAEYLMWRRQYGKKPRTRNGRERCLRLHGRRR